MLEGHSRARLTAQGQTESGKAALHHKGLLRLQHVITRPRKVCRPGKRPREISVAVLAAAFALFLFVGLGTAGDTAAPGAEVASFGQAPDGSSLEHDGNCESLSISGYRLQATQNSPRNLT